MPKNDRKFLLADLPNYVYTGKGKSGFACPECYRPLESRKRVDGRCDVCLKDKRVLPVNYRRAPKKHDDEEDVPAYSEE